jgi:hypothetical protein
MATRRARDVSPNDPGPASPAPLPGASIFDLLNRILDFLFAKFKGLPRPLRAFAYFILLTFFCATVWQLVAGTYVIRGVIWDGDSYAQGYEVRLRGDYFSTNTKGMYYAVVSASQYYRFLLAGDGDIKLTVVRPRADGKVERVKGGPFAVTFNWWDDEFSEIDLTLPPDRQPTARRRTFPFVFTQNAYAQAPSRSGGNPSGAAHQSVPSAMGDRLVIERITLGDAARRMKEVEFEVEVGEEEVPLLLHGSLAGWLPLREKVTFGSAYYFDLPRTERGTQIQVEMETPGFFGFFAKEEEFSVPVPSEYDKVIPVRGSRGSTLYLRLVPRTAGEVTQDGSASRERTST